MHRSYVGRLKRGESGVTVEPLAALEIGKEVDALLKGWREVGEEPRHDGRSGMS